jgi:ABC-type phosphate transport system substrate-binding protein
MARLALGALLALALGALAPGTRGAVFAEDGAAPLVVVAHARVPDARLDAGEVRRIFLLRRRFWRDGSRIRPVNLPAASPTRLSFSRTVLGSPPRELADYFNDLYFHGTRPPPVLESERAVLLYVARTPGAVGYVPAAALAAPEAAGLKVLLTLDAR